MSEAPDPPYDPENDYAEYYVVIADTSDSYATLHQKMFDLSSRLQLPIDTLGRTYNAEKRKITLPDTSSDEQYAGEYAPRRFLSYNLSIEQLDYYRPQALNKTMALVIGIFQTDSEADSALARLQTIDKKGFKVKSRLYLGCIH